MLVMGRHEKLRPVSLMAPVRNRYYFGKLLDAVHFELEQDYFNSKRWLINRMVLGYGVVCGLDVQLTPSGRAVRVTSGLAIDKWGREILVPTASGELEIPERPKKPADADGPVENGRRDRPGGCDDEGFHLLLCYHECPSSPEPGLSDDCGQSTCTPSLVEERYKLSWKKGKAPEPHDCLPDLLSSDGRINRRALAMHITHECCDMPCDPCLALANLTFAEAGDASVDITIRPVVYTNDLLFTLIGVMQAERMGRPHTGK